MILVNQTFTPLNATYIAASDFASMPNDYDLSSYNDTQLNDILLRASGAANSILRRNLLAKEVRETHYGDGSPSLQLGTTPILYVRQVQFVQPGVSGFVLPTTSVFVDYRTGMITTYEPVELQGLGYVSVFPRGVAFVVTYAAGYGYNPVTAPTWSSSDGPPAGPSGLIAGTYTVGLTSCTQWGETLPSLQTVTTASGAIVATAKPVLGAFKYRTWIAQGGMGATPSNQSYIAGATTIQLAANAPWANGSKITLDPMGSTAETVTIVSGSGTTTLTITATVNAHGPSTVVAPLTSLVGEIPATLFGPSDAAGTISSLTPPAGYYAETAPLADSSTIPLPQELREAVRLLAMQIIYEQNNLSNRGVYSTESGRKRVTWKSTEGTSGRGVPLYYQQAIELLSPKRLSSFFGK